MILPFYHVVAEEERDHYKHLYPIRNIEEFKSDLDFLLRNFRPINLKELIDIVYSGKKTKEKVFHLTFDDGLSELYTIVAPLLKQKGVPATFFINTDFIDNKELFYRFKASILTEEYAAQGLLEVPFNKAKDLDGFANTMNYKFLGYLNAEKPYLTTEQIQELINDGFTVGAHSLNHPMYKSLSEEEQIKQTLESVNYIADKFNLDYKVFSFPFTDDGVGKSFYTKVNKHLDLTFGTAGIKKDVSKKNLQRIPMEENKKGVEIIKSQYLYYILKSFVGKNTIKR